MIKAELWAIRHALKLCKDLNWIVVPIETDCQIAMNLIHGEEDEEHHPERRLQKLDHGNEHSCVTICLQTS